MLAALNADRTDRAPREYTTRLFDRYADSFDAHLVRSLHYRVPQLLRRAVQPYTTLTPPPWRIADLGCGTGLCAFHLRDLAEFIIGVDLSPNMIEHARRRGVYDTLITGDLLTSLTPQHAPFDLIVAADVFIYLGELRPVFARAADALRPDALFAFSTERCAGHDFQLLPTGRFAHSPAYIDRLAHACGFQILRDDAIDVRIERRRPIPGQLYVLRRIR